MPQCRNTKNTPPTPAATAVPAVGTTPMTMPAAMTPNPMGVSYAPGSTQTGLTPQMMIAMQQMSMFSQMCGGMLPFLPLMPGGMGRKIGLGQKFMEEVENTLKQWKIG